MMAETFKSEVFKYIDNTLPRGARPSPRYRLAAATPHKVIIAPPTQFAFVPQQLNPWGNSQYGDCVSAEEAFAKACYSPEIFIPEQTVIDWARRNGYLNGADLSSVIQSMEQSGFQVGSQLYNDGPYTSVDYSNETVLQSAISQGPVKIAIAASVLPSGAGSNSGWYITGNHGGANTDHCVSLCGYGPAEWLYSQLNVTLPSSLAGKSGYLLYTWATIGFVDHAWLMGTCAEAWLRNPTTVGVPPLITPVVTPPIITSPSSVTFKPGVINTFTITASGNPVPSIVMSGCNCFGVTCVDNKNGTATLSSLANSPPGNYTFSLSASNGSDPVDTVIQNFNLVIGTPTPPPSPGPVFTSENNYTVISGINATFAITTTGTPDQIFSSNLPSGVTLIDNKDGTASLQISANTQIGTFNFVIAAVNASGATSQQFTLTVNPTPLTANTLVVVDNIPNGTYLIGDKNNPIGTLITNDGISPGRYSVN